MQRVNISPYPHSLSISCSLSHSLSIFSHPGCKDAASCATLFCIVSYCVISYFVISYFVMSSGDAQLRRAVAPHGGLMDPGGTSVHCILPLALVSQRIIAYHNILYLSIAYPGISQHIMAYHNIVYLCIAYHGISHHITSFISNITASFLSLVNVILESSVLRIGGVFLVRFYRKILSP